MKLNELADLAHVINHVKTTLNVAGLRRYPQKTVTAFKNKLTQLEDMFINEVVALPDSLVELEKELLPDPSPLFTKAKENVGRDENTFFVNPLSEPAVIEPVKPIVVPMSPAEWKFVPPEPRTWTRPISPDVVYTSVTTSGVDTPGEVRAWNDESTNVKIVTGGLPGTTNVPIVVTSVTVPTNSTNVVHKPGLVRIPETQKDQLLTDPMARYELAHSSDQPNPVPVEDQAPPTRKLKKTAKKDAASK